MADKYCSVENVKFLLHEVHDVDSLLEAERFQDFDAESIDFIVDSSKDLADIYGFCCHRLYFDSC